MSKLGKAMIKDRNDDVGSIKRTQVFASDSDYCKLSKDSRKSFSVGRFKAMNTIFKTRQEASRSARKYNMKLIEHIDKKGKIAFFGVSD